MTFAIAIPLLCLVLAFPAKSQRYLLVAASYKMGSEGWRRDEIDHRTCTMRASIPSPRK
jgi:hypothetical protein